MKRLALGFSLLILTFLGAGLKALGADSASFLVSGVTVAPGSTFSVPIYESSGNASVNTVKADINYDPSQLKVVGTDFSDSDFPDTFASSDSDGLLSLQQYVIGSATGQAKLGTVTFMDIGTQPSTTISFASSSSIDYNGVNLWDGNTAGATFSFMTPAPAVTSTSAPAPQTAPVQKHTAVPKTTVQPAPVASVQSQTANPPLFHVTFAPARSDNRPWETVIVGGFLVITALLARLFNVHRRIKARVTKRRRRKAKGRT